jgi:hypothetical protein
MRFDFYFLSVKLRNSSINFNQINCFTQQNNIRSLNALTASSRIQIRHFRSDLGNDLQWISHGR